MLNTNKELELKYSIDKKTNSMNLLNKLKVFLKQNGWTILSCKKDKRKIYYYDSPNLFLHSQGFTLRRSFYDPKKYPKKWRYDYKTGKLENRKETKVWTNKLLNLESILRLFNIKTSKLKISARVQSKLNLIYAKKLDTLIEIKYELCFVDSNIYFIELEFELIKGNKKILYDLGKRIELILPLTRTYEQKYSRIIKILEDKKL